MAFIKETAVKEKRVLKVPRQFLKSAYRKRSKMNKAKDLAVDLKQKKIDKTPQKTKRETDKGKDNKRRDSSEGGKTQDSRYHRIGGILDEKS